MPMSDSSKTGAVSSGPRRERQQQQQQQRTARVADDAKPAAASSPSKKQPLERTRSADGAVGKRMSLTPVVRKQKQQQHRESLPRRTSATVASKGDRATDSAASSKTAATKAKKAAKPGKQTAVASVSAKEEEDEDDDEEVEAGENDNDANEDEDRNDGNEDDEDDDDDDDDDDEDDHNDMDHSAEDENQHALDEDMGPGGNMARSSAASASGKQESEAVQEEDAGENLGIRFSVGGPLTSHPVLFSPDSKHFFVCNSRQIKVFSAETSEVVRVLAGHEGEVMGCMINPKNPLQLISWSLDKTIRFWDYQDAVLLRIFVVNIPVHNLYVGPSSSTSKPSGSGSRQVSTFLILNPTFRSSIAAASPGVASVGISSSGSSSSSGSIGISGGTGSSGSGIAAVGSVGNAGSLGDFGLSSTTASYSPDSLSAKTRFRLYRVDLGKKQGMAFKELRRVSEVGQWKGGATHMTASANPFGWFATAGECTIRLWRVGGDDRSGIEMSTRTFSHDTPITCIAFHPTEDILVTGDAKGRLILWYNLTNGEAQPKRPSSSILHWHAHAVAAVSFTPDGAYLLSGGEEGVLVSWQLSNQKRKFLPRLKSGIIGISVSPNGSTYCISHTDAEIKVIVAGELQPKNPVVGLKFSQADPAVNPLTTGVVVEPRHNHIVLNGSPGAIQFFDAIQDRHVAEIEAAPRNQISRNDADRPAPISSRVDHVAFSTDGTWMATAEKREDGEVAGDSVLKFWEYNVATQSYVLNTRVDAPHWGPATGLVFRPETSASGNSEGCLVVTIGGDRRFRIWQNVKTDDGKEGPRGTQWQCRSVGFYRDEEASSLAFSEDGSLLAVAYGATLTLWDPVSNGLCKTLSHSPRNDPIVKVEFCRGKGLSHLLIAVTSRRLYVWNMLTFSVWWCYEMSVSSLAFDPYFGRFAVIATLPLKTTQECFIFKPTSPKPIFAKSWSHLAVKSMAFLPRRGGPPSAPALPQQSAGASQTHQDSGFRVSDLLLVVESRRRYELLVFGIRDEIRTSTSLSVAKADQQQSGGPGSVLMSLNTVEPETALSSLLGLSASQRRVFSTAQAKASNDLLDLPSKLADSGKKGLAVLDAASHVLLPIPKLFDSIMSSLLAPLQARADTGSMAKQKEQKEEGDTGDRMEEDDHEDEDEESEEKKETKEKADDADKGDQRAENHKSNINSNATNSDKNNNIYNNNDYNDDGDSKSTQEVELLQQDLADASSAHFASAAVNFGSQESALRSFEGHIDTDLAFMIDFFKAHLNVSESSGKEIVTGNVKSSSSQQLPSLPSQQTPVKQSADRRDSVSTKTPSVIATPAAAAVASVNGKTKIAANADALQPTPKSHSKRSLPESASHVADAAESTPKRKRRD